MGFPIELEIAAKVKCSLHGERFNRNVFFVYVSKWLRESSGTISGPLDQS
jgi:hypothetical protein